MDRRECAPTNPAFVRGRRRRRVVARIFKPRGWSMDDSRGSPRRSLWFTVISGFSSGGGTYVTDHSGLRSYNSTTERRRKGWDREREAYIEVGRDLAWLRLCIAPYSQSPLTSPRCLFLPLSLSFFFPPSTPFLLLLLVLHLSSVHGRSLPFRRSSRLASGRCAFVAPTIALPISVITACETRVRLHLLLHLPPLPSPSFFLYLRAFVPYRPSCSFHLHLRLHDALSHRPRAAQYRRGEKSRSWLRLKIAKAATLVYKSSLHRCRNSARIIKGELRIRYFARKQIWHVQRIVYIRSFFFCFAIGG